MTKNQDKILNILRTKRDFSVQEKAFLIIFKVLSVAKNCLRPESVPESVKFLKSMMPFVFHIFGLAKISSRLISL